MNFVPNFHEQNQITMITKVHQEEYAVVRLTPTMLHKAIIDASASIRSILKRGNVVDYDYINLGPEGKIVRDVIILANEVVIRPASFYRPQTKNGDPRLWIYGLKDYIESGEMIYLTVYNEHLVIIPLVDELFSLDTIYGFFDREEDEAIKEELIGLLSFLNSRGPVLSVSPFKRNPKDIGETLEQELSISPNSSKLADFKSSIELKAKLEGMQTKDTLFSMVPNWHLSAISSSNQMIQTFGYPSRKYEDYNDLFVTVSNRPNNQGLFLEVDEESNLLYQYYMDEMGRKVETAVWELDEIKERLKNKHPETIWVVGEEVIIDGKIHFHYKKAVYTRTPIFSSFLMLISQGIVTYDWRGRVREDGTGYKDKGHCFRISPKYRHMLFTELEIVEL